MIAILTVEQKNKLVGQWYAPDSYFNPIQDINSNWVISKEEIDQCVKKKFKWVKDLELIAYEPKNNITNGMVG